VRVDVLQEVRQGNRGTASVVRARLDAAGVTAVNILGSPGAGKTSLVRAVAGLINRERLGVIEGDLASSVDTDLLVSEGITAVQVNTGGDCHLSAAMVASALDRLPLECLDLLLVENVGNLVCTADVEVGTHRTLVLASVPEGDDKPLKYPAIFAAADAIVVTKVDTTGAFDFDLERFSARAAVVNGQVPCWGVSVRTGEGLDRLISWLDPRWLR
jgi:hydrogenase nickel incorporation protein HypB